MANIMGVGEAKKRLSELMSRVAYRHERFLIERHGSPMAALVSAEDLEQLEQSRAASASPLGALALVGAWKEMSDEDLDSLIADIYAQREEDTGRAVELEA